MILVYKQGIEIIHEYNKKVIYKNLLVKIIMKISNTITAMNIFVCTH